MRRGSALISGKESSVRSEAGLVQSGFLEAGMEEGELTQKCREVCVKLGLETLASEVDVRWNGRMRSSAGRASWPKARIELNPRLLEISDAEVLRTLWHELAHLVALSRAGRKRIAPHGREWRKACADLGIPGERATHRLELPSRKLKRRWKYRCPGCGWKVERVRRIARKQVACGSCCREAGGGFRKEYVLVEERIE